MDLFQLRRELDEIDSAIVLLYKKRLHISRELNARKKRKGLLSPDRVREQELLLHVSEMAGAEYADETQSLFREIFSQSACLN